MFEVAFWGSQMDALILLMKQQQSIVMHMIAAFGMTQAGDCGVCGLYAAG